MTVANAPVVRPLMESDRDQWSELWRQYLEFYETAVAPEVYDSSFARLLSDDPHSFNGLVAVQGDRLVGIVHYLFHAHMWKIEPVCYLQDLYALPDMRGKGVGRMLIEAVYAAADAEGAPTVYWLTQDFNHTARRLYDRIGKLSPFIRYGRVLP
jgi:GNAT superfamily N-acetyltransferase